MPQKLTTGRVSTQLTLLTLPMIWGVFAVVAFNLVDTYFVGKLGTDELAAMSFTFPVVTILGNIAIGLGVGASSVIARAIGEGDRHKVKTLTSNSLTLSVLIVGVFVVLGLTTMQPLFVLLGARDRLLDLVIQYMTVWYLGMIFLVIPMVGNSAIRAGGNTLTPSIIMTIAAVVNIVLDPIFIFGWGIIPPLQLQGAALATVIARATTLVAALWVLHFKQQMLLWKIPKLSQAWGCWKQILYVGLPAAGTNMIVPISVGFITSLMAAYGAERVAGFGIASRIESFAVIALIALSASIGPFVGQNWGAEKYDRVKEALHLSFMFCLAWGISVAVILGFSAPQLATIFDRHPEVIATASLYLRLVPITYATYGIILVSSSTFNALGKPIPSVIMTLARMLVLYVPLAYLGSRFFGVVGIFGAASLANLIVGIGAYIWNQRTCDK